MKTGMTILALGIAFAANARDWYVDADKGSDETGDGTAGAPFETINRASTNAAFAAGETIFVAPGDYDKGWCVYQGMTNRVHLPKTTILKATSSDKRATRIIGAWDLTSGSSMKTGPAAIRCVRTLSANTVISGFTICNGSANSTGDNDASRGGGVYGDGTVVDCIIENCRAYKGGGARNCTSIRTFFIGNDCSDAGGGQNGGKAYFCVFVNNGGSGTLSSAHNAFCTFLGSSKPSIVGTCTAYNAFFAETTGCGGSVTRTNCVTSTTYDIVSPLSDDWRLVAGCPADGAADRNLLAQVPSAYRDRDILGNPIPAEGALSVGAVMESADVFSGGFVFKNGTGTVNGVAYGSVGWYRPSAYPAQVTIVPAASADGKPFLCFTRAAADGGRTYPQMDGTFRLLPPPDKSAMCTLTAVYADKVLYVNANPEIGSDTTGTGEESAPYETLQRAITAAGKNVNTLIHAAPGDYRKGGKPFDEQGGTSEMTNIVNIGMSDNYCLIRGAGAANTFITGAPDPDTKGLGSHAVRPVVLYSQYAAIQGFTIRDGWTDVTSGPGNDQVAIFMRNNFGAEAQSQLLDCVVTNCHSASYGFSDGALRRCRIVGNGFGSNFASKTFSVSCEFIGNGHGSGNSGLPGGCRLFGCTVVGRSTSDLTMGSSASGMYLTIFETGSTVYSTGTYGGDIAHNIATVQAGTKGFTVGDPLLTDVAGGDLRPMKAGIAGAASGNVTNAAWFATVWPYVEGDVTGKSRTFGADGTLVVGAHAEQVDAIVISATKGGLKVAGATGTTIPVKETTEVTISLDPTATEPCIGFVANGVTNLFVETPSVTFTAADVAAAGGVLTVEALYSSDWYVDGTNGDDANSGMLANDAFKTLPRALTNKVIKADQTVHVARGLYATSQMKNASTSKIFARAVVPANVTLLADEGPAVTEIRGADGEYGETGHKLGLGTNAVRCVFLGASAKVKGFTLSGGRTLPPSKTETSGEKTYSDWLGGAVYGGDSSQVVEDCVITNCCANRGGATCHVKLVNCRVTDNHAVNYASASYYDACYGTLFVRNSGGTYSIQYPSPFVSCTMADAGGVYHVNYFKMENSLIMGACNFNFTPGADKNNAAYRSVFTEMPSFKTGFDPYADGGCKAAAADVVLDDNFRPVVCEGNVVLDAARPTTGLTDKDASGGQRVYNRVMDIGALEADYRPVFAKAMGRGVTVTAADPTVTLTADGVVLTNGALTAAWRGKRPGTETPYAYALAVTGAGELTADVGGVTTHVDAATSPKALEFRSAEANIPMSFVFMPDAEADGQAVLSDFKRQLGLLLLVR